MAQNLYSVEKQAKMQATTTILVVEDDLHVGYVLAQALKEEFPSKVIFATDALQALKMIRLVLSDLILLDYHLPQMDGLAFIDHLRASIESEQIPVVLMSGSLPAHLPRHQNVIAIKKPFELAVLLEQVTNLLEDSASPER